MLYNNPLSAQKIEQLLAELWLTPQSQVLEVGAGEGQLLLELLQRFNCQAVAVEPDATALAQAQQKLAAFADQLSWYAQPFQELELSPESFDACFSLGATHAFGEVGTAFSAALHQLKALTRPAGLIVIGHGYWRKPPDLAYLAASGVQAEEMQSHVANIAAGQAAGLELIYTVQASKHEWDQFEGAFWMAAERAYQQEPDNASLLVRVRQRRAWKQAYLKWGRETMGFGLYVFLKPR